MNDLNEVRLMGRLTRQAEATVLPSGKTLIKFSVATNRAWLDQKNEWQKATDFFGIAYFVKSAEKITPALSKGRQVLVIGSLRQDVWEKDGKKNYQTKIMAQKVYPLLLPSNDKSNSQPASAEEPAYPPEWDEQ